MKSSEKKDVKIMGIININDDSFFYGSRASSPEKILERINTLVEEGADIIDIGACSTRPGSEPISSKEEWKRLAPALKLCRQEFSMIPISIDTFRAPIVQKCYEQIGPFMVNDISAGEDDPRMLSLVADLGLSYIAMHKRGNSKTMHTLCEYSNIVQDIVQYFRDFELRANKAGLKSWIIDPGFGFAKTIEQNYELLDNLEQLKILNRKILIGISRKGFIYKPMGLTPEEALPATTELHKLIIRKGIDLIRVHDVAPLKKILST